jgi:hypothetical protein
MLASVGFQCGETKIDICLGAVAIRHPDFLNDGAVTDDCHPDRAIVEDEPFDWLPVGFPVVCAFSCDSVRHGVFPLCGVSTTGRPSMELRWDYLATPGEIRVGANALLLERPDGLRLASWQVKARETCCSFFSE